MKAQNNYKINHIEMTITFTKKFIKAAGILNSPEYIIFKQLRANHPDYRFRERKIAKRENKQSYANLTYEAMKTHIAITEGKNADSLRNLEKVIELSKGQAGHYAYVKKWFLDRYPDYNNALAITVA